MKIYISGKITGNKNYYEQFQAAEDELTEAGFEVVNPAHNICPDYKSYIDTGLEQLMECEAIYLLEDYLYSRGALLEADYARTAGLLMYYERSKHLLLDPYPDQE